ncbi:MAG: amidase, partial [Acidimicrobiia bacterium]
MKKFMVVLVIGASACSLAPPSQPSTSSLDVVELSAVEARERMASGAFTSEALTRAYLDRIAKVDDDGPKLDAVIELNPRAIADAQALD